jgi:putative endonuclease
MNKNFCVYMMSNKKRGVIYTGVSSNLIERVYKHKNKLMGDFSKRYNTSKLVYFEMCGGAEAAIVREKQIKKWNRDWKIQLIEKENPEWNDLYDKITP